jgi:hypothetical protein
MSREVLNQDVEEEKQKKTVWIWIWIPAVRVVGWRV